MSVTNADSQRTRIQRDDELIPLGLQPDRWDLLVALAGNPNTGKSTVFNSLTGSTPFGDCRHLLVAPGTMRSRFTELIRREAEHAAREAEWFRRRQD